MKGFGFLYILQPVNIRIVLQYVYTMKVSKPLYVYTPVTKTRTFNLLSIDETLIGYGEE